MTSNPFGLLSLDALVRDVVRDVLREELRSLLGSAPFVSTAFGDDYLSPKQAAKLTGHHADTVRGWVKTGKLKAFRGEGGRALRIRRDELHAFMARGAEATQETPEEIAARILAKVRR